MALKLIEYRRDTIKSSLGSFLNLEYVIHMVTKGKIVMIIDGNERCCTVGDILIMPPLTLHSVKQISGIDMIVMHFNDIEKELSYLDSSVFSSFENKEFETLCALTEKINKHWPCSSTIDHFFCDGLIHTITGFILSNKPSRSLQNTNAAETGKSAINRGISIMHESYSDKNLSVSTICDQIGLSYNYFCSQFKKQTNSSPGQYLSKLRIETSKEMMFNSNMIINEIAEKCGFNSPQYYCRCFKKETGLAPKKWMKLHL